MSPAVARVSETITVPALVERAGDRTLLRFVEFFAAHLANRNTREAYARALRSFLGWCEARGVADLAAVAPLHVAGYREALVAEGYAVPTVKQHLAAVRELFDWLVAGQLLAVNPASSVRGPRYSTAKGLTPVLPHAEARRLLDSINPSKVVGLRDRALIGVLVYTFARVSAAVGLTVADYYPRGKRWRLRLHEKNGKVIDTACHHQLEQYLDAYLAAAGIAGEKEAPLFRSARGRSGQLTANRLSRVDAWCLVRRRAADAGIAAPICCHTFRATGITAYLENKGTLERAQKLAGHASSRTTSLYDRREDEISTEDVERIIL